MKVGSSVVHCCLSNTLKLAAVGKVMPTLKVSLWRAFLADLAA